MAKNRTHLQCNSVVDNHGLVNDYRTMSEIRQVKGMSRNNEHTSRQTHLQCDSVGDDHGLVEDNGVRQKTKWPPPNNNKKQKQKNNKKKNKKTKKNKHQQTFQVRLGREQEWPETSNMPSDKPTFSVTA